MITVRMAEMTDAARVNALYRSLAELHRTARPDVFASLAADTMPVAAALIGDNGLILVAEDEDGTVQGMIMGKVRGYRGQPAGILWIDDLIVEESARGRGVGSALLAAARDYGRRQGCTRLELNVWAFNETAIRFYEKNGLRVQRYILEEPI
ncbi:MAG: GNAT family N-acetyltransferase [Ruminococcaceae bacterium]|nr:GNAT family N-acetyltransferase [Oscillospiraceae bacterium]